MVDDAAVFPPGDAPLPEALAAHTARRSEPWSTLVGSFVLKDTDLPQVRGTAARLSVVCTGGAGQVAGPLGLAAKLGLDVVALEIALRDLDDLAGNARRVVAAVDEAKSGLDDPDGLAVFVELPGPATHGWLTAADEVAAREDLGLRLKFRTGGLDAGLFPPVEGLAAWIDAALDRETPFKCTAGLHHAVRHTDPETGFVHHGFLNVLAATRTALDGGDADAVLAEQDAAALVAALPDADTLARTRRWFTSFGSCSVTDPRDDLLALGLISPGPVPDDTEVSPS
ncbi:hypothetical protein ETU37_08440 [Nocardioides iriomotensis]|uniref:Uncharacterized protein n=1 Tax=Nocardioides iriomotensis TaxID=715784 RepID=A0A4Q5J5V3_9ACTN|nr:hypothetical protein ETU37_08440 [Nocardioides iriomotensis]